MRLSQEATSTSHATAGELELGLFGMVRIKCTLRGEFSTLNICFGARDEWAIYHAA